MHTTFSVRFVAALAASFFVEGINAQAKVVNYVPQTSSVKGVSYSVNIPSSTARSGNGPIYIQMVAPSGTQWLGLGQGSGMAGANMFVMYSSGSDNITLSPRLGKGEFEPEVYQQARITLLEGTGISSDGIMTANFRCDSCIAWSGGSMSPTNGKSGWVWSIKQGSALNSGDLSADIKEHDAHGTFTFDLPAGTSSDSANPFVEAATATQSAGSTRPSNSGEDQEKDEGGDSSDESSSGSSEGSSLSQPYSDRLREAHGIIMAVVFLFLFPIGALMVYLPFSRKIVFAHAPIQLLSACLLIAGMALGIRLGLKIDEYDGYHQIIGYVIVSCLLLFQPALGLMQHLRHRKVGKRTIFGHIHRWLGRILVLLGIINGGLGLYVSGEIGSDEVPRWAVIAYSVVAAIIGIVYIAVAAGGRVFRRQTNRPKDELKQGDGSSSANGS